MDAIVFFAVLAAAFMHASWTALVKSGGDRLTAMLLLSVTQCAIAALLFPLFPAPAQASWIWIGFSALLHVGYKLFLAKAYSHGDLSQIYPIARGSAPLIVAIVGALFLHEEVGATRLVAVAAIGLGVIAMSMRGGGDLGRLPPRAIAYALATAGFTASYTLADAIGARLSGSASGYVLAMFATDGACMTLIVVLRRGLRVFPGDLASWRTGFLSGGLSLASYWVAIWAFTKAPVALVAALRETSVLMALLIGVLFLGESGGRWRWIAAGLIACGVALMRF